MTQAWPWPAPEDDGAAAHIVAGMLLPPIALPSSAGVAIDLSRCQGRAVVFVYPFTGTPGAANPPGWDDIPGAHGSTPEAHGFRGLMPMFAMKAVRVYGLSAQASADQQAFARREALTFPLLSDSDLRFADALRLPTFATGGVTYLKRLTFVVRDGIIERTFYPVHPPHCHAGQVLAALD